jgi:hypothetical protein
VAMVRKVFSADPKGSEISSQGICGYISVIATYSLIKGKEKYFVKNKSGTFLIGDMFI